MPEEGTKDSASSVWEAKSCVATIALNTVASLIDVRAAFQKNVYSCEEDVIVEVYLRYQVALLVCFFFVFFLSDQMAIVQVFLLGYTW